LASNNASGLNSAGLPGSLSQASSATFGTGFGGSLDLGLGHGLDGKEYGSWGGTIGEVFGAGVGYGAQYTYITPINGGWPSPK